MPAERQRCSRPAPSGRGPKRNGDSESIREQAPLRYHSQGSIYEMDCAYYLNLETARAFHDYTIRTLLEYFGG